jgi:hypothetical protein
MIITKTEPFTKEEFEKQLKIIGALAMDLKRVSLGLYNGSTSVADRFWEEAIKKKSEIETSKVPDYICSLLKDLKNKKDFEKLLMYSTLLQNYSINAKQT